MNTNFTSGLNFLQEIEHKPGTVQHLETQSASVGSHSEG